MEIMRGCTQGCRFCQAGYWYRPVREHDPEVVADRIEQQVAETGFERGRAAQPVDRRLLPGRTAGLRRSPSDCRIAGYRSACPPARRRVLGRSRRSRVAGAEIGLHLCPGDRLGPPAPGDQQDLHQRRHGAGRRGRFLQGMEPDQGLRHDRAAHRNRRRPRGAGAVGARTSSQPAAAPPAAARSRSRSRSAASSPRRGRPSSGSRSPAPKSCTGESIFSSTVSGESKGHALTWSDPEEAALEALLSRGGRNLAGAIERAHDLGAVFDGWTDFLDLDAWRAGPGRRRGGPGSGARRARARRDPALGRHRCRRAQGLPQGRVAASASASTRPKTASGATATAAAFPGDGDDTQLATAIAAGARRDRARRTSGRSRPPTASDREPSACPHRNRNSPQPPVYRRYRFTFIKTGRRPVAVPPPGDGRLRTGPAGRRRAGALHRGLQPPHPPVHGPGPGAGSRRRGRNLRRRLHGPRSIPSTSRRANELLPDGVQHRRRPAALAGRSLARQAGGRRPAIESHAWPRYGNAGRNLPDGLDENLRAGAYDAGSSLDDGEPAGRAQRPPGRRADWCQSRSSCAALGIDEDRRRLGSRVTREMLVLRPRQKTKKVETERAGAAV